MNGVKKATVEEVAGLGIVKIMGPYIHRRGKNIGRRHVAIVIQGRTLRMFLSRWLMIKKLGRLLKPNEEVDHIDEDKINDSEDNLQLLNRQQNADKMAKRRMLEHPAPLFRFNCLVCKKPGSRMLHRVRSDRKAGYRGPFCSKSCAATYSNLNRARD